MSIIYLTYFAIATTLVGCVIGGIGTFICLLMRDRWIAALLCLLTVCMFVSFGSFEYLRVFVEGARNGIAGLPLICNSLTTSK